MSAPSGRRLTYEALLAAFGLGLLYLGFRQTTWSLDGAIHTLGSLRATDDGASGHILLRPVAWGWTQLLSVGGPLTFSERYDSLELLFMAFGIAALVMLFVVVRRRVAALPAWLALMAVALMRCTERQITDLDEKPLGMLTFAVAVLVTDATFRRLAGAKREPGMADAFPMGLAWVLAVAGHLQSAPFAVASLGALGFAFRGPGRVRRALVLGARVVPLLAFAGVALVTVIHVGAGGWRAMARLAEHLFVHRPAPPEATSVVALVKSSALGWVKAFFLIDRLSPTIAVWLAGVGFLVLGLTLVTGFARRRDPLASALLAGSLGLMVLIPAANFFPDYGDSYTMMVLALFVPLASATPGLIAASGLFVLLVNLPAADGYSHPETTMQKHITGMIAVQEREQAPWVVLQELRPFDREQGLSPIYYRMSERLRVVDASLDALPPERFLLELPQPIERDGSVEPGRVAAMIERLAGRGRRARAARLDDSLRTVRSDFRRYGDYLVVEPPAPTR